MGPVRSKACAAAMIAVALAGCGSGSSGVSPATYVHAVCATIYPYDREVVIDGAKLAAASAAIKTPVQAKRLLQAYITTVSAATDSAVAKLQAAGSPNVKNGKRIASTFVGAFTGLKTAIHRALADVNALPTTSVEAFRAGIARLGLRLNSIRLITARLQSGALDSTALHKAAGTDPACRNAGTL